MMIANLSLILAPIFPELVLAGSGLGLLLVGAFKGNKATQLITNLVMLSFLVALVFTVLETEAAGFRYPFEGLLANNGFIRFGQSLVILTSLAVLLSSYRYFRQDEVSRFEYPILVAFSVVGMLVLIASNDLILFFLGLELQSLPVYVLVAMNRNSTVVGEAALKYFLLGALSSVLILYGFSFVYGFTGSTEFPAITAAFGNLETLPPALIFALILIVAGLGFKISAVPFHMWTPDVYQGSPTPVTLFIATAPKIAAIFAIIRLLMGPLGSFLEIWQVLLSAMAILSMGFGAYTALFQQNIKRLLAYSTITHMGYALIGLATGTETGIQSVLIYITLYVVMTVGIFACLLNLRRHGQMPVEIEELRGLSKTHPGMAAVIGVFMFSLAGIPPLAGFFGKLSVFMAAVDAELYALAIIGVLASVVAAAYYLRIIKTIYFEEPVGGKDTLAYDASISGETTFVIALTAGFTLLFFLWPELIIGRINEVTALLFAITS